MLDVALEPHRMAAINTTEWRQKLVGKVYFLYAAISVCLVFLGYLWQHQCNVFRYLFLTWSILRLDSRDGQCMQCEVAGIQCHCSAFDWRRVLTVIVHFWCRFPTDFFLSLWFFTKWNFGFMFLETGYAIAWPFLSEKRLVWEFECDIKINMSRGNSIMLRVHNVSHTLFLLGVSSTRKLIHKEKLPPDLKTRNSFFVTLYLTSAQQSCSWKLFRFMHCFSVLLSWIFSWVLTSIETIIKSNKLLISLKLPQAPNKFYSTKVLR